MLRENRIKPIMNVNTLMQFNGRYYNSYNAYLKRHYGERVQKVTVDGGFTCPNRDGTVAYGGCTYCNNDSFNPGYNDASKSITRQIGEGTEFLIRRYNVDKLKRMYEEALAFPGVVGLTLGTRPDCVDDEKLKYLESLAEHYDITVEYGLESIYNDSLKKINRGHDYQSYLRALEMTADRGLKICTHIILGFPWENVDQWMHEAEVLSSLKFEFLKIHQLHIVDKTIMARQYMKKPFKLLSLSEYVETVVSFLERLTPHKIIQRLAGEAPPHILIAPKWGKRIPEILKYIDLEFDKRGTWQGKYFKDSSNIDENQ